MNSPNKKINSWKYKSKRRDIKKGEYTDIMIKHELQRRKEQKSISNRITDLRQENDNLWNQTQKNSIKGDRQIDSIKKGRRYNDLLDNEKQKIQEINQNVSNANKPLLKKFDSNLYEINQLTNKLKE